MLAAEFSLDYGVTAFPLLKMSVRNSSLVRCLACSRREEHESACTFQIAAAVSFLISEVGDGRFLFLLNPPAPRAEVRPSVIKSTVSGSSVPPLWVSIDNP